MSEVNIKKKVYGQEQIKMNKLDNMECFVLPQNKSKILYFKQIKYNLSNFSSHKEILPIAFLVFMSDSKAQLWVEDLFLPPNFNLANREDLEDSS